jgi:hypothetical protein
MFVLMLGVALSGCLSQPLDGALPTSSLVQRAGLLPEPDPSSVPLGFRPSVDVLNPCTDCFEPAIAVDPLGRVFTAANNHGGIGVSLDGGQTFTVTPVPPPASPLDGTGYPDGASDDVVQVAPWGTLFYTELWSDGGGIAGAGVHVASTDDAGATWKTNTFVQLRTQPGSRAIISDRQWLAFEEPETVHLIFNGLVSLLIYDMVSNDGGATFADPVIVAQPADHSYPSPEGLPFVDPDGYIVVPYWTDPLPPESAQVSVTAQGVGVSFSKDHGATWQASKVFKHAGTQGSSGGAWPAATVLANGTWVAGWDTRDDRMWLSFSEDKGATWSAPTVFGAAITMGTSHPWLKGRSDGGLDVVWFSRNETGQVVRLGRLDVDGLFTTIQIDDQGGGNSDYPFFDHTVDGRVAVAYMRGANLLRAAITNR